MSGVTREDLLLITTASAEICSMAIDVRDSCSVDGRFPDATDQEEYERLQRLAHDLHTLRSRLSA